MEQQPTVSAEAKPPLPLSVNVDDAQDGITTIKKHVETAKVAETAAVESQKQTATALADAQTKLADITAIATQALAAKTQIEGVQGVIATKSDHIEQAQVHADKVRAELDRKLTAATQQATAAEAQKSTAQSAAENAAKLLADVRTTKGAVETEAAAVTTARKTAEESAAATKGLADKSATVETRIAAYEKRLGELDTQCKEQLKMIESLLPGATSAGMAHDLDKRRQTFLVPQRKWDRLFIGSVAAIVVLAVVSLLEMYWEGKPSDYKEVLLLWSSRLPVIGALVWLALHSSHEAALAKRLEEDYGYKSAVASMFLGFQKQMSEVGSAAATNEPLAKLCADTLTTMASPPGRIYDKHKLTVNPTSELKEAAKAVTDGIRPSKS